MECTECIWCSMCVQLGVSPGDTGTSHNCNPVSKIKLN
jgi:hypothetical protein